MHKQVQDDIISRIQQVVQRRLRKDDYLILYGSRARGDAGESSDWDLLVLLYKAHIEQSDYDGIFSDFTSLG